MIQQAYPSSTAGIPAVPGPKNLFLSENRAKASIAEVLVLLAGALFALAGAWRWWEYLSSPAYSQHGSGIWPLPAGYLVEAVVLSMALVALALVDSSRDSVAGRGLAVGAGALTTLAILGAWSIGTAVLPAAVAGLVAAALAAVRLKRPANLLILGIAAGACGQALIMAFGIVFLAGGSQPPG